LAELHCSRQVFDVVHATEYVDTNARYAQVEEVEHTVVKTFMWPNLLQYG
jgi:hypothetical protein